VEKGCTGTGESAAKIKSEAEECVARFCTGFENNIEHV
jgi:hypothetical protein